MQNITCFHSFKTTISIRYRLFWILKFKNSNIFIEHLHVISFYVKLLARLIDCMVCCVYQASEMIKKCKWIGLNWLDRECLIFIWCCLSEFVDVFPCSFSGNILCLRPEDRPLTRSLPLQNISPVGVMNSEMNAVILHL